MKLLLIIFAVFHGLTLFSQSAPGYYITKTGDTIRGQINVPLIKKGKNEPRYLTSMDKLRDDSTNELKTIDYPEFMFDFKFSADGKDFKKYDRLEVKGFGFSYENHDYNFITWDVKANKQIFLIPVTGDVQPNGVYFILRSMDGAIPVYSMFWEQMQYSETVDNRPFGPPVKKDPTGLVRKRELIFQSPHKGLLYMSDRYPMIIKQSELYEYLELEPEFVQTLKKKEGMLNIVRKYNAWKLSK